MRYETPRLMALCLRLAHKHQVKLNVKGAHLALHLPGNGFLTLDNQGSHVVELATWLESRGEFLPDLKISFYTGSRLYGKDRWFPYAARELFGGRREAGTVAEGGAYLTIHDFVGHRTLATDCESIYVERLTEDGWLEQGIAVCWPLEPKPLDCEGSESKGEGS